MKSLSFHMMKITELPIHARKVMIAFTVFRQERIFRRDQSRHLREITRVGGSRAPVVHVVALVRTDPHIVSDGVVSRIRRKPPEIDDIRQP